MEKKVCRVITGPTASRKSALALQLARENGWDIVCMDSMQIYRRMNIGTAKPDAAERRAVPHHLFDICEPTDSFSVSDYAERAVEEIEAMFRDGKSPLFVGGTGLYLSALMHPMHMGNCPANEALRQELRALAGEPGGKEQIHERLRRIDPESAERLPTGDVRRMIRAIEVSEGTGIPFSRQKPTISESPYIWRAVSTEMDRAVLYDRINRRVEAMITAGLAEEVRQLLADGVPENAQSMSAIGYKEMIPYVRGECRLEETTERIQLNSRHYAKRQMTYLRREKEIRYVNTERDDAYETMKRMIK